MKERNVVLILMLMGVVLSGPVFAQPTAADVEALVEGGVYLDFVGNGVGSTRVNITVTTNASDWGYPDGSDSGWHVNGDCYDSKEHTASDFVATITGLAPGATYQIYLKSMFDNTDWGYAWGLSSASENVVDAVTAAAGIYVVGDGAGGKGSYLYQLRQNDFRASAAGDIALHFGEAGARTQVDGLLLVLTGLDEGYNPPPVVNAGAGQTIYIGDVAQLAGVITDEGSIDGSVPAGVASSYWVQASGPGTATFSPSDTTDVLDPTVTFDVKGVYELMLQATDVGGADANDIVVITVKDRFDEFLVGYWDFEDNVEDQSINSNDGTIVARGGGGTYDLDAAIGMKSINLFDMDPNDGDPNTNYVDLGAATELDFGTADWTVTAWVKTSQTDTGNIFSNGGDQTPGIRYVLAMGEQNANKLTLTTDDDVNKVQVNSTQNINDGLWHFVVGQRRGDQILVYVDGILGEIDPVPAGYNLSGTSQAHSYIGVGIDIGSVSDASAVNGKHLEGLIDDVRIYNFALPETDDPAYDSILSLAGMGPIVAQVDAGPDLSVVWKPLKGYVLSGTIIDNGRDDPGNPHVVKWSMLSSQNGGTADFGTTDGLLDAVVTFDEPDVYVLQLEVTDIDSPDPIISTVTIIADAPNCEEVKADGFKMAADINGDCSVDLADLAILLSEWLECNDPVTALTDPDLCYWPF